MNQEMLEYFRKALKENIIGLALISIERKRLGALVVSEGPSMLRKLAVEVDGFNIPVIVISKTLLLGDAYYDIVGDYIVSYLLFPLEIIYDKNNLLVKTVIDTRKRIIDEEVSILASYGKILSYAVIPIEYFPIKALSIRVRLYGSLEALTARILDYIGFSKFREILRKTYQEIIQSIIREDRLKPVDKYHVKLSDKVLLEPSYKKYIPRIKERISPIAMSIASFLIDEKPIGEIQSRIPIEFVKPHLMIKMMEGILGLGDWRELIEKKYGILKKEKKTSIVYATEIYRVDGKKVVVKQYTSPSSIKWILASIASILSKKFIVNSWERQYNEYHATIILKSLGFPHRGIVIVDPISAVTIFEYIEGTPIIELAKSNDKLSETAYKLTGKLLAQLHLNNIVMGDTKPDNYIFTLHKGEPMVIPIDLEQVKESNSLEEKAWDIAMFVYFHGMGYTKIHDNYIKLLELFLKEYTEVMGSRQIISEASKLKYQLPFMYIVPPHNLIQLNNVLKRLKRP